MLTADERIVRHTVDAAIQRLYLAALLEKSGAIGQIEDLTEARTANGEYEVTIRVRA